MSDITGIRNQIKFWKRRIKAARQKTGGHSVDIAQDIKDMQKQISALRAEAQELEHKNKEDRQKPEIVAPKKLTREEFNQEFKTPEASMVMCIPTIEDLDKAWPNIKGKSISIDAPDDVKTELMRRWREEYSTISVPGYRPIDMRK